MKLPVQSHQQSVRVQCHPKPLQLRHTGCSRSWKVGVSEAQFWITMDKSRFLGLYWTDVSIYEQLHMWASKWPPPPRTWIYPEMSFLPWRWYFTKIFQKSPSLHCSGTIPAGSEGSAQTITTYQEKTYLHNTLRDTTFLFSSRDAKHYYPEIGTQTVAAPTIQTKMWSKCWAEIFLISSPSC